MEEEIEEEGVAVEVEKEKEWDDEVVDVWSPDDEKHGMFISCVMFDLEQEPNR